MDISRQAGQEHMYKEDGRPELLLRWHESLHYVHQLGRSDITGQSGSLTGKALMTVSQVVSARGWPRLPKGSVGATRGASSEETRRPLPWPTLIFLGVSWRKKRRKFSKNSFEDKKEWTTLYHKWPCSDSGSPHVTVHYQNTCQGVSEHKRVQQQHHVTGCFREPAHTIDFFSLALSKFEVIFSNNVTITFKQK